MQCVNGTSTCETDELVSTACTELMRKLHLLFIFCAVFPSHMGSFLVLIATIFVTIATHFLVSLAKLECHSFTKTFTQSALKKRGAALELRLRRYLPLAG